jgi:hypothetical protein
MSLSRQTSSVSPVTSSSVAFGGFEHAKLDRHAALGLGEGKSECSELGGRAGIALMTPVLALTTQVRRLVPLIDARLVWFCGALLSVDFFFVAVYSIQGLYVSLYNANVLLLTDKLV